MLFLIRKCFRNLVFRRKSVLSPRPLAFRLPNITSSFAISSLAIIDRTSLDNSAKIVTVAWKNTEEESSFPYIWLRDNCRCEKCFEYAAQQRLTYMSDFNLDSAPKSVTCEDEGSELTVIWQDDHQSQFKAKWLKRHAFPRENVDVSRLEPRVWGSDLKIPKFDFHNVINDDQALYAWMEALQVTGLTLLVNVPKKPGQVQRIGNRVSFLKRTHHGDTYPLKAVPGTHNIAYSARRLGLHADLPHHTHMAGVQILHCIEQAQGEGGENNFADGLNIAMQLKKEKPDIFHTLATVPLDFLDVGKIEGYGYYFYKNTVPTFSFNIEGKVDQVSYFNLGRSIPLGISTEKMYKIYQALKTLDAYAYEPRYFLSYKMSAGELLAFNNRRLLHDRTAYTVNDSSKNRYLEGAYMDWDQIWSRMRVIRLGGKEIMQ